MDTNHFFCKINTTSDIEEFTKNDRHTIIEPFEELKIKKNNLMKTIKKSIFSLNLNSKSPFKENI